MTNPLLSWLGRRLWLLLPWVLFATVLQPISADAQTTAGGRVAGQVVDQQTGRPIGQARVVLQPGNFETLTDVSGRYRSALVPAGVYILEINSLGYTTVRVEGIVVEVGGTVIQNAASTAQALRLDALVVTVQGQRAASSEAGMLSMQRASAVVTDGISAEQMSRAPDSDAADAIARVTGVSVANGKYVIVRGLEERYSTTLLNGSELASPEPTKRVVPLDIFPTSLLDAVVTSKSASPDKPGEFAGGLVEIRTKDFPEQEVFELSLSNGYNNQSTFRNLPVTRRTFSDRFAFDGQHRFPVTPIPDLGNERVAESLRYVWTPAPRRVTPDFGFGITYGNQSGPSERALGYILSFDYGTSTQFDPDDHWRFTDGSREDGLNEDDARTYSQPATTNVNWGILANTSLRLGSGHTLSLRNLLTREAEEYFSITDGYDPEPAAGSNDYRSYQARYIERGFLQSQLSGKHMLGFPFESTLDWSTGLSLASRDEPENRSLRYYRIGGSSQYAVSNGEWSSFHFRYLDDRYLSGQLDWSIPFQLWGNIDQLFKVGGLGRFQRRDYSSQLFQFKYAGGTDPGVLTAGTLAPEQLTQPEYIGGLMTFASASQGAEPYIANNDVLSGYAMLDLPIASWLRLVGGVRAERWDLTMRTPSLGTDSLQNAPTVRQVLDVLPSANLTLSLTRNINLRLAAFRTVSRPDPREISRGCYEAVSQEGTYCGDTDLQRAVITNGDARLEWYPNPGELISISAFIKNLGQPIIEVVGFQSFNVFHRPQNAVAGRLRGGEFEFRKALSFLPGPLGDLSTGFNVTYSHGSVDLDYGTGLLTGMPMQHLSDLLVNSNLSYENPDHGLTASVLYNRFSDRLVRYGLILEGIDLPDVLELGRGTVDAKVAKRFGGTSVSLSGRNLTGSVVREVQPLVSGYQVLVGYGNPGVSFSLSLGYAF